MRYKLLIAVLVLVSAIGIVAKGDVDIPLCATQTFASQEFLKSDGGYPDPTQSSCWGYLQWGINASYTTARAQDDEDTDVR